MEAFQLRSRDFQKAGLNFRAEAFKDINDFYLTNLYSTEPEIKRFYGRPSVISLDISLSRNAINTLPSASLIS